jgi:predicted Zn-dependent protease
MIAADFATYRLALIKADRIGLTLMARASYDPREAIPFWERMSKQEESFLLQFREDLRFDGSSFASTSIGLHLSP